MRAKESKIVRACFANDFSIDAALKPIQNAKKQMGSKKRDSVNDENGLDGKVANKNDEKLNWGRAVAFSTKIGIRDGFIIKNEVIPSPENKKAERIAKQKQNIKTFPSRFVSARL